MKECKDNTNRWRDIPCVLGLEESMLWNDYTTQINLQIHCNPYQNSNDIFHRTRTKNCTICMEKQKTLNSQSNLEKEKLTWRNQPFWLQTTLQSYGNQKSVIVAPEKRHRNQWNRTESRKKRTLSWSINLQRRK